MKIYIHFVWGIAMLKYSLNLAFLIIFFFQMNFMTIKMVKVIFEFYLLILLMIIGFIFLFTCSDFDQIYENGGKDYLEKEFKDFKCTRNIKILNRKIDIGIEINLENFSKFYQKLTFMKLSKKKKEKLKKMCKYLRKIQLKNLAVLVLDFIHL